MRILMLSQWFQPEPLFKGLPMAKAFDTCGHAVEVLTGFPNYPGGKLYSGYHIRPVHRESMEGIPVVRVPLYPSHDNSGVRRILNYLSFAFSAAVLGPFFIRKPDVIYVYNLVTLLAVGVWFRFLWQSKLVIDVQDLWPESVVNSRMLQSATLLKVLKSFCLMLYKAADHVIVLSPSFKIALIKRGLSPDRITVIYNWCDETGMTMPIRDQALVDTLAVKDRFTVVFAGTMGIMQGLDTVLDAAQICDCSDSRVMFLLIGDGVDMPRLKSRAFEMHLKNVIFVPRQSLESIGKYYSIADATLVHLIADPLSDITIPSKTQAYLYMGKPTVMAVRGDAAHLIDQAKCGISCEPSNPRALASAVEQMAQLPIDELRTMGQNARSYYQEKLAMEIGVPRLLQCMLACTQVTAKSSKLRC